MSVNVVKKILKYSDLSAAATSATATIHTTRDNEFIERAIMVCDTDFAGGSVSAATISIGKSGSATKYLGATDVFTGVSNGYANATVGTLAGVETRGTAVIATLTTTTDNTDALTAGQVTIYLFVSAMPVAGT